MTRPSHLNRDDLKKEMKFSLKSFNKLTQSSILGHIYDQTLQLLTKKSSVTRTIFFNTSISKHFNSISTRWSFFSSIFGLRAKKVRSNFVTPHQALSSKLPLSVWRLDSNFELVLSEWNHTHDFFSESCTNTHSCCIPKWLKSRGDFIQHTLTHSQTHPHTHPYTHVHKHIHIHTGTSTGSFGPLHSPSLFSRAHTHSLSLFHTHTPTLSLSDSLTI